MARSPPSLRSTKAALDELREAVAAIREQAERWAEGEAAPTLSLSLR